MKRYYSKKDRGTNWIIWGTVILMWAIYIITLTSNSSSAQIITLVSAILASILLLHIYYNTFYLIEDHKLKWRSGPFSGTISLERITKIKRCESVFEITSMYKPSLTFKPLMIHYGKYDSIPMSPADEEKFIKSLTDQNSSIKIEV